MPLDLPKNTLLPQELLWRLTRNSNVLQDILPGGVGPGQISKTLSTDALSLKCHHALKDSSAQGLCIFTDAQAPRVRRDIKCHLSTLLISLVQFSAPAQTAIWGSLGAQPRLQQSPTGRRGPRLCRVPACSSHPEFVPSMDAPCSPGPRHSDGCYNYIQKGDQT